MGGIQMAGISKINYKNKEILYIDYSGLAEDKAQKQKTLEFIKAGTEAYMQYPANSALGLVNVENLYFDMEILSAFKESRNKGGYTIKKEAIIGVKGLIKAAYNFVIGLTNNTTRAFSSEQEAKEWLVSN